MSRGFWGFGLRGFWVEGGLGGLGSGEPGLFNPSFG